MLKFKILCNKYIISTIIQGDKYARQDNLSKNLFSFENNVSKVKSINEIRRK